MAKARTIFTPLPFKLRKDNRNPETEKILARLMAKIELSGECWVWIGAVWKRGGYGWTTERNKPVKTHRLIYKLCCGELPADKHVLHRCDNPPCVRPDHLFLGTQADNNRDMREKGRQAPAVSGEDHPMAKLTNAEVEELRKTAEKIRFGKTDYFKRFASAHGMTYRSVSNIYYGTKTRYLKMPLASPTTPKEKT